MSNLYNQRKSVFLHFKKNPLSLRNLWKAIVEAVSGTSQDFTKGSLNRAILLLSIPMVLEMMMESLFALFDTYFVARLGSAALATIAYTESMMTIFYAVGIGFSMATTALVARRIGENKRRQASIVASQAIIVGIVFSAIFAIPGIFFPKDLLMLMGASPETISTGYLYTSYMLSFNIVLMMLFIINAVFRSSGDAAISLRVLVLANLINIVLDPCLIFGLGPFPELGVKGAAIATVIGRGTAVVYQFYILFRGKMRIQVAWRDFKVKMKIIWKLITVSYGGIGQYLIATSSWVILVRILSEFGDEAVAGYQVAIRILIFTLLPSWGLSNAAATMVGQNLGAKKPDRAEQSVWRTAFINVAFLVFFAAMFIYDAEWFVSIFVDDANVIDHGSRALTVISMGYLCYAFGMVMPQAFNGAGDTATPTWINFISFWLIQIPGAYLLALVFGWADNGVYYSVVIGETVLAVLGIILFKRGKWKLKQV